jgi:hypothetical protein
MTRDIARRNLLESELQHQGQMPFHRSPGRQAEDLDSGVDFTISNIPPLFVD